MCLKGEMEMVGEGERQRNTVHIYRKLKVRGGRQEDRNRG